MNTAWFSPCRRYRYALWRTWGAGTRYAMFVGLNPSTADETADDPTIRRCVAFAKSWGLDALCMTNLFGFRATDPKDMFAAEDPIGEGNDVTLDKIAEDAAVIVGAWGNHGVYLNRDQDVRARLYRLHYLRLTKSNQPQHPLYLPSDLVPIPFNAEFDWLFQ